MVLEIINTNGMQVFSNADDGLAAEVEGYSTRRNATHRVVMRDTDACEVVAVVYGSHDQCQELARAFVTGGGTL